MVLLHGTLDVHIHEASDLPLSLSNQAAGLMKRVVCCNAGPTLVGSCDPYVCLDVGNTRRLRSAIVQNNHHPVWDQRATVYVADEADEITLEIKDADRVGAEFLGMARIPVKDIIGGQTLDQWLDLVDKMGAPVGCIDKSSKKTRQARLHVTITFRPVGTKGNKSVAFNEVPHTYFPLRDGNRVTLYHDSVCTPGPVEGISLAGGGLYSEASCWDDLYAAIKTAKRFIWITGWSIWTETRLVRQPDRDETSATLGELLKQKAEDGVNVLLLVWDDQTNNYGMHSGVMATHDQETLNYFKGSKVTCVLCPRQGSDEDSYLQAISNRNMFTHHQKTVILDAPGERLPAAAAAAGNGLAAEGTEDDVSGPLPAVAAPTPTLDNLGTPTGSPKHAEGHRHRHMFSRHKHKEPKHEAEAGPVEKRRVIAFVGGLDLTDGRYDSLGHPLFATLGPDGVHNQDFYQPCIDGFNSTRAGLREPWHDIHARVEGPVAMDIGLNFMERWAKQAGKLHLKDMTHLDHHGDLHLPDGWDVFASKRALIENLAHNRGELRLRMDNIRKTDPKLAVQSLPEPEKWSVQLFRSIDSDSAAGLPTSAEGVYECGLFVGKGKSIDASIHTAYIELIRNAKRYLYLENQYFLGSSHLWDADQDTPCFNQVPAEIALKIVSKIKAGEPFKVYIVTPLHPEGVPTSASVQAILHFQHLTRKMMYRLIADALEEEGITHAQPKDYLHFFCLGKREPMTPEEEAAINAASDAAALNTTSPANGTTSLPRSLSRAAGSEPTGHGPEHLPPADAASAQCKAVNNRRFMVYVHSKLMIVDDEYIVVGSANINQRSLDGTRDSEICIGAFQNGHVMRSPTDPLPRGQVAGFRKALWKEHTSYVAPELDDPSSNECMQFMQRVGRENWKAFAHKKPQALPHGLLMNYPIFVTEDGAVGALPGAEDFCDLGGKILGTKSMLPGLLTS